MSFFADVDKLEHSTLAWFESEITRIEQKAPTIERIVDAGLNYISPALQIGLTLVGDPAAAALVGPVVAKAQTALLAASALVTDFGPTPTAASIFASVQTNLSSLLAAGQIKSTKTIASITMAVTETGSLAVAVATAAAQVQAAAAPIASTPEPVAA